MADERQTGGGHPIISASQKENSACTRSVIIGWYIIVKQKQTLCFVILNFSNFADIMVFSMNLLELENQILLCSSTHLF